VGEMNKEIPKFLIEMSKQMKEQPNRCTSDPFWQVRCKRYMVTEEGYNEHHWVLSDADGELYRSDNQELSIAAEYLQEHYTDWFDFEVKEARVDESWEDQDDIEIFCDSFDFSFEELPEGVNRIFVQEYEDIISTHLTEADAKWFINRKQHDYPPLYTHVESAYWSPQIKELRAWVLSLTEIME
jgi:hypothetical protein